MLSIYHSWDVLMMAEGHWKQSWDNQWQPQKGKGQKGGRAGGGKGVKAPWASKAKIGSRKGTLAHH